MLDCRRPGMVALSTVLLAFLALVTHVRTLETDATDCYLFHETQTLSVGAASPKRLLELHVRSNIQVIINIIMYGDGSRSRGWRRPRPEVSLSLSVAGALSFPVTLKFAPPPVTLFLHQCTEWLFDHIGTSIVKHRRVGFSSAISGNQIHNIIFMQLLLHPISVSDLTSVG